MRYDFEKFFDLSMDLLCILGTDGYLKRVNPSFERTLGWTAKALTSRPFVEFIHPDDIQVTLDAIEKLILGYSTASFESRLVCADKSYRQLTWTSFPDRESGLLFAVGRDMTDLVEANRRFRQVLEASPAAMVMTDTQGNIRLVNREAERIFGFSRDEMLGESVEMLVPQRYRVHHQIHRSKYARGPQTRPMGSRRDLIAITKDGTEFPVEIGLNPMRMSDEVFILSSIIDLTARKDAEEKIIKLAKGLKVANAKLNQWASTDVLTDLNNRRVFDENLKMLVKLTTQTHSTISLLLIDVDDFQAYSDNQGHLAGEEVLKTVADLLRQNARTRDVIARFEGNEFATILPDTSAQGALNFACRLQEVMKNYLWKNKAFTFSMGVSTASFQDGDLAQEVDYGARLLAEADEALSFSRQEGGDQVSHQAQLPTLGQKV